MNRFSTSALGATLVLATAAPVLAGSPSEPVIEPVPSPISVAPSSDWTGGYIGIQLGYGELTKDLEGDGVIGGVTAGYDWDLGDWVVGLGADANFGDISTDAGDLDSLSRLKLRGGYDFGRTLLYVTTGASYADSGDFGNSWGYFGGVGVEHMLDDAWSLTGEISAHRFDDFDNFDKVNATTATIGVNYRF